MTGKDNESDLGTSFIDGGRLPKTLGRAKEQKPGLFEGKGEKFGAWNDAFGSAGAVRPINSALVAPLIRTLDRAGMSESTLKLAQETILKNQLADTAWENDQDASALLEAVSRTLEQMGQAGQSGGSLGFMGGERWFNPDDMWEQTWSRAGLGKMVDLDDYGVPNAAALKGASSGVINHALREIFKSEDLEDRRKAFFLYIAVLRQRDGGVQIPEIESYWNANQLGSPDQTIPTDILKAAYFITMQGITATKCDDDSNRWVEMIKSYAGENETLSRLNLPMVKALMSDKKNFGLTAELIDVLLNPLTVKKLREEKKDPRDYITWLIEKLKKGEHKVQVLTCNSLGVKSVEDKILHPMERPGFTTENAWLAVNLFEAGGGRSFTRCVALANDGDFQRDIEGNIVFTETSNFDWKVAGVTTSDPILAARSLEGFIRTVKKNEPLDPKEVPDMPGSSKHSIQAMHATNSDGLIFEPWLGQIAEFAFRTPVYTMAAKLTTPETLDVLKEKTGIQGYGPAGAIARKLHPQTRLTPIVAGPRPIEAWLSPSEIMAEGDKVFDYDPVNGQKKTVKMVKFWGAIYEIFGGKIPQNFESLGDALRLLAVDAARVVDPKQSWRSIVQCEVTTIRLWRMAAWLLAANGVPFTRQEVKNAMLKAETNSHLFMALDRNLSPEQSASVLGKGTLTAALTELGEAAVVANANADTMKKLKKEKSTNVFQNFGTLWSAITK